MDFWTPSLLRKLEKAVAVRNSLLEEFSGKFRRCWKIIRRFSGSTKCYPCEGLGIFKAAGKLAAPAGMLLDFLLRDRHSLLEFFWTPSRFLKCFLLKNVGIVSPSACELFFSLKSGTDKVPQELVRQRFCRTLANFLAQFASKPLFYWVVPSKCSEDSLVLFVRFF